MLLSYDPLSTKFIKRSSIRIAIIFCFIFSYTSAICQEIPAKQEAFVNDFAQIFSPQFVASLEQQLREYDQKTSNQIVVVTIADLQDDPILFATDLGDKWGVGSNKDNGVVFLIAPNQRKVSIATGYGVEAVITDAHAKQIIDQVMLPAFKTSNYEQGLVAGIQSAIGLIGQTYQGDPNKVTQAQNQETPFKVNPTFILFAIFFFYFIISRLLPGKGRRRSRSSMMLLPFMMGGRSSRGFGGGGFGGGGFGGFGGGGFGGGGASGGW